MDKPTLKKSHQVFGGQLGFYQHASTCCKIPMNFAVYEPPKMSAEPVPVLYFLSGLTCTEENFVIKSGALRYAAQLGLCLVAPDTSPRNTGIDDENEDWTYGSGAGFYVDATQPPWSRHYQMYTYVVQELPELVQSHFNVSDRMSVMGHSMGGHGALVVGLRNPKQYESISAFAPICNPAESPWTQKALKLYLGEQQTTWLDYDATTLVTQHRDERSILIDQGLADQFLEELRLDAFEQACVQVERAVNIRRHSGYDHGYFFISTFIEDHLQHHANALQ